MKASQKKQKQHTIRFEMLLTPEQNEAWEALAAAAGISKAELVRRRMAGCRIRTIPEANWQCYWQLLKLGTNINQIAKAQNTAITERTIPSPIDPIPFVALQRQIDKLRLHLILGNDDPEDNNDWENQKR